MRKELKSGTAFLTSKTKLDFTTGAKLRKNPKDIYASRCFRGKCVIARRRESRRGRVETSHANKVEGEEGSIGQGTDHPKNGRGEERDPKSKGERTTTDQIRN